MRNDTLHGCLKAWIMAFIIEVQGELFTCSCERSPVKTGSSPQKKQDLTL
jgi:hypothetical protein